MRYTIPFTLQQLKALNSLHGDLHLTVSKMNTVFTVSAKDRDTFNIDSKNTYEDFIQELQSTLIHYPNTVTVNGQPLETVPYPSLAHASITSYRSDQDRSYSFTPIKLEPHTDRPPGSNAFAGGVLAHIPGLTQQETVYYTPGHQTKPHWQRADKVELHPRTVITPEEIDKLTDEDLKFITSMTPYRFWGPLENPDERALPSHITRLILDWRQRAQDHVVRTMQNPNAPPKHEGDIFQHTIVPPNEDLVPYTEGSPLIVHGIPLLMDDFQDRQDYLSIAHALYMEDHGLVPVDFTREQAANPPHHLVLADYSFTHRLGNQPTNNDWCIKTADQISLDLDLLDTDGEKHITITAPFHLGGNTMNKKVHIVPAQTDPDTLAEKMTYAYWDIDQHNWDGETKENFENLNDEMTRLVTAAMGKPVKAFQEQLTEYANKFHTDLPWPKEEITAHSHDRSITVIYQPRTN